MDFCMGRPAASQSTSYMQSLSLHKVLVVSYNPLLEFMIGVVCLFGFFLCSQLLRTEILEQTKLFLNQTNNQPMKKNPHQKTE